MEVLGHFKECKNHVLCRMHEAFKMCIRDRIVGGVVPRQYIPAVEKGLRECMEEGVLAGYPAVNVRCKLYDGSFHPVAVSYTHL